MLILSILVAAGLGFLMFSPWTAGFLNFWWAMTFSAITLTVLSIVATRRLPRLFETDRRQNVQNVLLSICIAVVLWLVFYWGDIISQRLFDFARPQVNLIYDMKTGMSPRLIGLLLLFIIGPAEEIFWRGYIQRTLSQRFSPTRAFLITTGIYTLVHLPSLNLMLIMAAMVCGLAWGGLYRLFPGRLPAIILSHALWDAAAFVWFPF